MLFACSHKPRSAEWLQPIIDILVKVGFESIEDLDGCRFEAIGEALKLPGTCVRECVFPFVHVFNYMIVRSATSFSKSRHCSDYRECDINGNGTYRFVIGRSLYIINQYRIRMQFLKKS